MKPLNHDTPLHSSKTRIQKAYDTGLFTSASLNITQMLSDHMDGLRKPPFSTLDWTPPAEMLAETGSFLREEADAEPLQRLETLARHYIAKTNHLQSPNYIGHQVPAPIPVVSVFEMIGACLNQPSGIYEMGPFSSACEKAVIQKLGGLLGWKPGHFEGVGTHGGSLANLTAILAARNWRYKESWARGTQALKSRPALLVSADCHYSITRAAGIIGIGAENILKAPLDSKRRIDVVKARALLEVAQREGQDVFCIVGSACATPIGAFDPLKELAALAHEYGIWFHVDAAHGAPLLFSKTHRGLLHGIELADSITWDAHKMMFVPALCTFLLYRDKARSYLPFSQDAPYLFDRSSESTAEFDSSLRTVECTKRPLAMAVWATWSTFGSSLFEDLVDVTLDATQTFCELLEESDDFEPAHEPECNILCFKYLPPYTHGASHQRVSEFQMALRKEIVQSGNFYITGTRLDGVGVLRVSVMNPLTEESHFIELMNHIRKLGEKTWNTVV